jgi:hypothetical protein
MKRWFNDLLNGSVFAFLGLMTACGGDAGDPESAVYALEEVTGAHTRVVWLQDAWEHEDVFSDQGRVRLMTLDSRDGQGEQIRVPGPAPLRRPLLSSCGEWIVYSRDDDGGVWKLGWDAAAPIRISDGVALAVVELEETLWIYIGHDPVDPGVNVAYERVVRVDAMNPGREEFVWDAAPVGRDNFQLSADGRMAAAVFPWPNAGIADLEAGIWEQTGRGCWPGMAPLEEPLMWILDGAHRNIMMAHGPSGDRWQIPIARHEAFGGHEIYHPRWSSHPRFMAMSGPYKIRKGGNNIRGGGDSVEIFVGRFDEDWRSVEAWAQVTDNEHANFFPDVWVARTGEVREGPLPGRESVSQVADATVYDVRVRLLEITPTPSLADIAPYTEALAAHLYEVIEGPDELASEQILIAHWVIRDRLPVDGKPSETGTVSTLRIREYDAVPELEGERLVIEVSDLLLPLFVAQ